MMSSGVHCLRLMSAASIDLKWDTWNDVRRDIRLLVDTLNHQSAQLKSIGWDLLTDER